MRRGSRPSIRGDLLQRDAASTTASSSGSKLDCFVTQGGRRGHQQVVQRRERTADRTRVGRRKNGHGEQVNNGLQWLTKVNKG